MSSRFNLKHCYAVLRGVAALILALCAVTGLVFGLQQASAQAASNSAPRLARLELPGAEFQPTSSEPTSAAPTPLVFIENTGQFEAPVRFQVNSGGAIYWLTQDAIWLTLVEKPKTSDLPEEKGKFSNPPNQAQSRHGANLRISFPGANQSPELQPVNRLEARFSYFHGNDPSRWRPDVPVWGGVIYHDLYPGVDLEISGLDGHWSWRMIARDPAALRVVRLQIQGADQIDLPAGLETTMALDTAAGKYILPLLSLSADAAVDAPALERSGQEILGPFQVAEVTSQLLEPQAPDDDSTALVYSTFLGGAAGAESAAAVTTDGAGHAS